MSQTPENEQEFRDRDFERSVYEAMKSCGWLLPKTPEELRQAEDDLAANPVELPESLRDPFRILDAAHSSGERPDQAPLDQVERFDVKIPAGLDRVASEFGLTLDHVTSLISMQAQIIANRSTTRNEDLSYEDWKRFYEAVKEFL